MQPPSPAAAAALPGLLRTGRASLVRLRSPLGTLPGAVSSDRDYRVAIAVAFASGSVIRLAVVWRSTTMAP